MHACFLAVNSTKGTSRAVNFNNGFRKISLWSANFLGSPWAFIANVILILIWLAAGPLYNYSDTWQLLVNTATTVFTYLAVFLIQNTQNRDAKAVHLKLDELITTMEGARNRLVDLEDLSDEELEKLQQQFLVLKDRASRGGRDASGAVIGEPDKEPPGKSGKQSSNAPVNPVDKVE